MSRGSIFLRQLLNGVGGDGFVRHLVNILSTVVSDS